MLSTIPTTLTDSFRYDWDSKLIDQTYTYAANQLCLIKLILIRVLGKRKEVRAKQKLLKGSTDPDDVLQYAVYEGQQLAYKVTASKFFFSHSNSKLLHVFGQAFLLKRFR